MESFFEPLSIASIMDAMREELELPFSAEEIIESMQNDKTSGPDRFPVEFFKRFSQTLKAPLLDMLLDSLNNGCLPPTLIQACISLLLKKKNKDPHECGL